MHAGQTKKEREKEKKYEKNPNDQILKKYQQSFAYTV
jgi:hypothetical protein